MTSYGWGARCGLRSYPPNLIWVIPAKGAVMSANQPPPEPRFHNRPLSAWAGQLRHPEPRQRRQAAYALGRIGPPAQDAVPALIAALRDGDSEVRWQVTQALGRIGPAARAAVPALLGMVQEGHPDVRYTARQALERVGIG